MSYCISRHEDGAYEGSYETVEQAIAAAPDELALEPGEDFWVGRSEPILPRLGCDGDSLLEYLAMQAGDLCGEVAEDWLSDVPVDKVKDLEAEIDKVIHAWLKKHDLEPKFWSVEGAKAYSTEPPSDPALPYVVD